MARSTLKIILTSLPLSAGLLVALVAAQDSVRRLEVRDETVPTQLDGIYIEQTQPGGKIPVAALMDDGTAKLSKRVRKMETVVREVMVPLSEQEAADYTAYVKAEKALKEAKDDAARQAASEEFLEVMNKAFDRDLEEREKELKEVEKRVESLRAQLDKRKAARDEIISLRLKTIVYNAEGLGFPDNAIPQASGQQRNYEVRRGRMQGVPKVPQKKAPLGLPQEQDEEIREEIQRGI